MGDPHNGTRYRFLKKGQGISLYTPTERPPGYNVNKKAKWRKYVHCHLSKKATVHIYTCIAFVYIKDMEGKTEPNQQTKRNHFSWEGGGPEFRLIFF